jgi:PAS domain S-box-containing protein
MRLASFLLIVAALCSLLVDRLTGSLLVIPSNVSLILLAAAVAAAFLLYLHPRDTDKTVDSYAGQLEPHDSTLQTYAARVANALQQLYGRSCAFVLLAAPTGQASVQYISNLDRSAGSDLLERLFNNWRDRYPEAAWQSARRPLDAANEDLVAGKASLVPPSPILSQFGSTPGLRLEAQMLEFAHDAVIIWQMDGAGILYWNRAAERLYGYTSDQARGKVTHTLLRTQPSNTGIEELEKGLARFGVWVGELRHVAKNGRSIRVESRLALIAQEDGRWLVLEVNHDVTDSVDAKERSRAPEHQLSELRSRVG